LPETTKKMEIEMENLPKNDPGRVDEEHEEPAAAEENTIQYWAWGSAAWLLILSMPLLLFPRFLLFLSQPTTTTTAEFAQQGEVSTLTPLESYLATQFAILLISMSIALIASIPSSDPVPPRAGMMGQTHPLLVPMTIGSLLCSVISYNTPSAGALGFLVALGSGVVGVWGAWAIVFAGSSLVSKKTGADKRTSRFLFGNTSSAGAKKKEWKKAQKTS